MIGRLALRLVVTVGMGLAFGLIIRNQYLGW